MILKNVNQNPQGSIGTSRSAVMALMAEKEASAQPRKTTTIAGYRAGVGNRYLRLPELRRLVPLSPATIWRKSRNGTFPPAIKLSDRITCWSREAVEAWLAAKEAV